MIQINTPRPLVPVILSGGAGSRLWPLSRAGYPKQLLPLVTERSLLQETVLRAGVAAGFLPPVLICNEAQRFLVAEQMRTVGVTAGCIALEPEGRNTAPAVATGALLVRRQSPGALMAVFASDHAVADTDAFIKAVSTAAGAAAQGYLATLGITPDRPDTGYGYIRRGAPLAGCPGAFAIQRFVEKPDRARAEAMLAEGGHDWNSAMFVFDPQVFLDELQTLEPEIYAACGAAVDRAAQDLDFLRLDSEAFCRSPARPVDTAVMERTSRGVVVPADLGWSDVGSWHALWQIARRDSDDNSLHGPVVALDSHGSYVRAEHGVVGVVGLTDMVVVATDDAVFVAPRDRASEAGLLVERLRAQNYSAADEPTRIYRPWGWYQSLDQGPGYQVKHLYVYANAKLSLQMHHRRAEHWIVVSGTAQVVRGDSHFALEANQSTYIPVETLHRLGNDGPEPLSVIEIQSGDYLGEDDIVRFEDDFGRTASD
ncbi:MAG: mannose-1-phosphate guanylyltransferase/mannose-6-phosphate isomerase [Alphaproteobacteria bacterium]